MISDDLWNKKMKTSRERQTRNEWRISVIVKRRSAGQTNYKFQIKLFPRAYLAFTYKSPMCEATRYARYPESDLESTTRMYALSRWQMTKCRSKCSYPFIQWSSLLPLSQPLPCVFLGDRYWRRYVCIKSHANREYLYVSRDKNFQKFENFFTKYLFKSCKNIF